MNDYEIESNKIIIKYLAGFIIAVSLFFGFCISERSKRIDSLKNYSKYEIISKYEADINRDGYIDTLYVDDKGERNLILGRGVHGHVEDYKKEIDAIIARYKPCQNNPKF